jgi:hypothetical protein
MNHENVHFPTLCYSYALQQSQPFMQKYSLTDRFEPGPPTANPCDIYDKQNIGNRRPINYTSLREGDVAWEKRVWRDIDMREKQNQPLYYPLEYNACRSSLFQTITRQILNGNYHRL